MRAGAVTGDNSGGDSQKDSNIILKVSRDRECAEWLTFDGSPTKQDYDAKNDSEKKPMLSCKKLSDDKDCDPESQGNGWGSVLSTEFYLGQMNGNWFNEDFSGFAIPGKESLNNSKNWWKDETDFSTSTSFLAGKAPTTNVVCKAYPETDSPFNFSDKYDLKIVDCGCEEGVSIGEQCGSGSGKKCIELKPDACKETTANANCQYVADANGDVKSITYEQFKSLTPRDYFKNVNSGITIPYDNLDGKALIRVDDNQDCYYQKVNYKDVLIPKEQYAGKGVILPSNVCYNSTTGVTLNEDNTCKFGVSSNLQAKVANYTDSVLQHKGYCAEFDYSHEIYYPGSGKYNCITWIPGFISDK